MPTGTLKISLITNNDLKCKDCHFIKILAVAIRAISGSLISVKFEVDGFLEYETNTQVFDS